MSLAKQATSLAVMHAFEVLQPLLILPYAGWVLGPHHFGQYAYAISIGQFATTFVEYGFHWTAQRSAAAARQEPAVIASLFAEVFSTKLLLCVLVTAGGLAAAGPLIAIDRPMFMCVMLTAIGGIVFPGWLFIGLERAWQAAVAVVIARTLALVCFLVVVTSPDRVGAAVAIQSAIPLVAGIICLPFIRCIGFGGFASMTFARVAGQLRSGWRGFLFSFVERASITLPVPIVAHLGGYALAGQFSVAEKFVSATRPLFRIITDTLLPRVAYYARHDPRAGVVLIWRSLLTLGIGATLALLLFFIAPYVITTFFGEGFAPAVPLVRGMAVIPLLVNGSICMSTLYMFNYGHERAWSRLTVSGLLMFIAVACVLPRYMENAALAVVIAIIAKEALVFSVSAGFFMTFGAARARISLAGRIIAGPAVEMITAPALSSSADAKQP